MPLSTILKSAAGTCAFCHQKTGILSREHPQCLRTYQAGWQEVVQLIPPVAMAGGIFFFQWGAIPEVSGQGGGLGSVESGKARSCQPSVALGKRKSPAGVRRASRLAPRQLLSDRRRTPSHLRHTPGRSGEVLGKHVHRG